MTLQLIVTWHQPLGASGAVLAAACQAIYLPWLAQLEAQPSLRTALHIGGHLLDHLARHQGPLLTRLATLQSQGRLEVLAGPFYGPEPALVPEGDLRSQVQMASEFWYGVLGATPAGCWWPAAATAAELPLLLCDTEIAYVFVAAARLAAPAAATPLGGLVSLQRGGVRLAAFVVAAAPAPTAAPSARAWLEGSLQRHSHEDGGLLTLAIAVEPLGAAGAAWLAALASASQAAAVAWTLPAVAVTAQRPAQPAALLAAATGAVADALRYPEMDTIGRRMLRASERLREAVATMEDEGKGGSWGGALATAQRQLFAAQSGEVYRYCAAHPYFDAGLRDAAQTRLAAVETTVDGLAQSGDFIAVEDVDLDGDLVEELWVASGSLAVWLVPSQGGVVRHLEERQAGLSLLDASGHGCSLAGSEAASALPPLLPLGCRGLRPWLLEAGTTVEEFFAGEALNLLSEGTRWATEHAGIDEAGDADFLLITSAEASLPSLPQRQVHLRQEILMAIDRPCLTWRAAVTLAGEGAPQLALELPLRGEVPASQLWADGVAVAATAPPQLLAVTELALDLGPERRLVVAAGAALNWWWGPIRDAAGAPLPGLLLVPLLPLQAAATCTLELRLSIEPGACADAYG